MSMPEPPVPELIATLDRWQGAGGTWLVVGRSDASVTVALCRCDGGEEMERITSRDPLAVEALALKAPGPRHSLDP